MKPVLEIRWSWLAMSAGLWAIIIAVVILLAGCVRNDWQHEPYDPKHSAADRYGQRSKFVDGLFWRDLCEGAGGEWSNGGTGACSIYPFQRPSIGEPNG